MIGSEAEMHMQGPIGDWGWTPSAWKTQVDTLLQKGVSSLKLVINSEGGDVIDAMGIVDCITELREKMPVHAHVCGLCASAATVIACACDSVSMTQNSSWMVHEPTGAACGTLAEIQAYLKMFNDYRSKVYSIYTQKTGKTEDQIQKDHVVANYYRAEEAKAYGFVDVITAAHDEEPREDDKPQPGAPPVAASRLSRLFGFGKSDQEQNARELALQNQVDALRAELTGARASQQRAFLQVEEYDHLFETRVNAEVSRRLAGLAPSHLPPPQDGIPAYPKKNVAEKVRSGGFAAYFKS